MAFCKNCGMELNSGVAFCQKCGTSTAGDVTGQPQQPHGQYSMPPQGQYATPQQGQYAMPQQRNAEALSEKDWLTTVLLSFFLGGLGVDHFYVGKIGTGIIKLITLGGCGIWALVDFILIVCGSFRDSNGLLIKNKN